MGLWALLLWGAPALAGSEDRATTTVGGAAVWSHALGRAEGDVLVGERLDLGLSDAARLRFDGRVTLDAAVPSSLEWLRLRSAGVQWTAGDLRLDLGRAPVEAGGPRLVDGAQALLSVGDWRVGAWAGLAPDLFTTLPRLRYGGGPVLTWERRRASSSLVGEVLTTQDGLDRLGALWLGRTELGRTLDVRGRVDVQGVGGALGLADAAVFLRTTPSDRWRIDAFYDAYSSLRYLETADLDPWIERFLLRAVDLGIDPGISADLLDPSLRHLVGASLRASGDPAAGPAFVGSLSGRGRVSPDPTEQFVRAGPMAGVHGLAGGRLDVEVDAALTFVDEGLQGDGGVLCVAEPFEAPLSVDASVRGFWGDDPAGSGWYADLYTSWLFGGRAHGALIVGVFGEALTDRGFIDQAEGAFLRLSVDPLRGTRSRDHGAITRNDGPGGSL